MEAIQQVDKLMVSDEATEPLPSGGSTMVAAYVVIGVLFCCSILIFLVFMLKMKAPAGETPRNSDTNKVRNLKNDSNASYNRFGGDEFPELGVEQQFSMRELPDQLKPKKQM